VDDGSSDRTASILSTYKARKPRLRILRQDALGLLAALNNGLVACQAPYVARMDADDVAFPDRLALQFAFLEANPQVVAVGGQIEIIDSAGADCAVAVIRSAVPTTDS
jgi:glycosyltransferase involved in cell wall biosynthesis